MLGRAVNLYFITKYKNISTRKPKYCRAAMRIKEFILYGLTRENRKKIAIVPLILKYIFYSVYAYGTLDCRIDINGLFSSLNES